MSAPTNTQTPNTVRFQGITRGVLPPQGFADLYFDSGTGQLTAIDYQGNSVIAGGGGTPGGSDGQVQYNDAGAFGGSGLILLDPDGTPPTVIVGLTGASVLVQAGTTGGLLVDVGYSDVVAISIKNTEANGDGIIIIDTSGTNGGVVLQSGDGEAAPPATIHINSIGLSATRGAIDISGTSTATGCDIALGDPGGHGDTITAAGTMLFGNSTAIGNKLGFFGTTPIAIQSSTGVTTVAALLALLVNYGLFTT